MSVIQIEGDLIMLGNKEIMAANIRFYMNKYNKTRNDICKDLGFAYSTFTDWINGNKYPRIDKIEMMANYFNITKADLVEDRNSTTSAAARTALTPDQQELLADYELLNKEGQQEARKQVHNLTRLEEYTQAYEQDTAPSRLGA